MRFLRRRAREKDPLAGAVIFDFAKPVGTQIVYNRDVNGSLISAQNGSTAGADANDAAFNGTGLVFGADDFMSVAETFMRSDSWTVIAVVSPTDTNAGRPLVGWGATAWYPSIYSIDNALDKTSIILGASNYRTFTVPAAQTGVYRCLGFACGGIAQDSISSSKCWYGGVTASPDATLASSEQTAKTVFTLNKDGNGNGTMNLAYFVYWNKSISNAQYLAAYRKTQRILASRGITV